MNKWENKFEELQNRLDKQIQELKMKVDDKTITKEEYKEYNKLLKVKDNMPKINNMVEYRGLLLNEKQKIEEQLNKDEQLYKLDEAVKKLDERMQRCVQERTMLENSLYDENVSKEDKHEILEKIDKINADVKKNNEFYFRAQDIRNKNKKMNLEEKEQLETRKNELSTQISKCNLVIDNLINGMSWDSIEMNLDKWKDSKFKADKVNAEKLKSEIKTQKQEEKQEPKTKPIKQDKDETQKIVTKSNSETIKEDDYKNVEREEKKDEIKELPIKVSKFDQKHPRLAKIKNWFKNKIGKYFAKEEDYYEDYDALDQKEREEAEIEAKQEEQRKNDIEKFMQVEKQDNEFKKYLKEVAEKGYKNVGREKLEEAKKEAYKRETEKFGETYAKKSYDSEEER